MNMISTKKKILIKCILIILCAFGITHFYLPKFIIEPNNPIILSLKYLKNNNQTKKAQQKSNVSFINNANFKIKGRFNPSSPQVDNKGTILLIHGIRGNRNFFDKISTKLNKEGYNTFALDLRAHGESEGQYCTFGAHEKYDISQAIDQLKDQYNISDMIGVWGQSLGGSIAIQAMAIDNRIKFGVIESTFSSYETITHDYFNRLLHLDVYIFIQYLTERAAKIASFTLDESNTALACKHIEQPVFIAHGSQDIHIPIKHGETNFQALQSEQKTFRIVEGADHTNLWEKGGHDYFKDVLHFINNTP